MSTSVALPVPPEAFVPQSRASFWSAILCAPIEEKKGPNPKDLPTRDAIEYRREHVRNDVTSYSHAKNTDGVIEGNTSFCKIGKTCKKGVMKQDVREGSRKTCKNENRGFQGGRKIHLETESSVQGAIFATTNVATPVYSAEAAYACIVVTSKSRHIKITEIEEMMGPILGHKKHSTRGGSTAVFGAVYPLGAVGFRHNSVTREGYPTGECQAVVLFDDIDPEEGLEGMSESQMKQYILIRWRQIGRETMAQRPLHVKAAIQTAIRRDLAASAINNHCRDVEYIGGISKFPIMEMVATERFRGMVIGYWKDSARIPQEDKNAVCYIEWGGRHYLTVQNMTCDSRFIAGEYLEGVKYTNLDRVALDCRLQGFSEPEFWRYCSLRFQQRGREKEEDRDYNIMQAIFQATRKMSAELALTLITRHRPDIREQGVRSCIVQDVQHFGQAIDTQTQAVPQQDGFQKVLTQDLRTCCRFKRRATHTASELHTWNAIDENETVSARRIKRPRCDLHEREVKLE